MAKRVPGERRKEILQTLAHMLENPKGEKITTALLASKLDVSEAALYRHFASKAQMFEGLIEFSSICARVCKISLRRSPGTLFAMLPPKFCRVLLLALLATTEDRTEYTSNDASPRFRCHRPRRTFCRCFNDTLAF